LFKFGGIIENGLPCRKSVYVKKNAIDWKVGHYFVGTVINQNKFKKNLNFFKIDKFYNIIYIYKKFNKKCFKFNIFFTKINAKCIIFLVNVLFFNEICRPNCLYNFWRLLKLLKTHFLIAPLHWIYLVFILISYKEINFTFFLW
jgi:hypothetical protein